jgi:hypothetical protein
MTVRGRADRLDFLEKYETVAHFRLLYTSGTFYPIRGAMTMSYPGPWQIYRRRDVNVPGEGLSETWTLIGEFPHDTGEPDPGAITDCFERAYRNG